MMGYWVMFVAGLVAVANAEGDAAPVAAAPAEPATMVYYGQYKDSCGADGLYYNDEVSFVVCDHGKAHVQPCAPGSYNDKMEMYKEQDSYAITSFCGNIRQYAPPPPMVPSYHHYHGYYNPHAPYYHGYYHHAAPYYFHGYHHGYPHHQYHNDVDKLAYQKPYQKHPAQPVAPVAHPAPPQPAHKAAAAQPAAPMPAKVDKAAPAAQKKY